MGLDISLYKFTTKDNYNAEYIDILSDNLKNKLKSLNVEIYTEYTDYFDFNNPNFEYSPDKGWTNYMESIDSDARNHELSFVSNYGKPNEKIVTLPEKDIPTYKAPHTFFLYDGDDIYYQRNNMNDDFYKNFKYNDLILYKKDVKRMVEMSKDKEYTQGFLDKFIEGETFILIDY